MKKIFLVLALFLLIGAGCSQKASDKDINQQANSSGKELSVKKDNPADNSIPTKPIDNKKDNKKPVVVSKPIIISPTEGELVTGDILQVSGKTKPNYQVWGYKSSDQTCITKDSLATGGASVADSQGNFVIQIPTTSLTTGQWEYFVATQPAGSYSEIVNGCYSADSLSEVVRFRYAK